MSTRIDEIADGIYRLSTPLPPEAIAGGFTINQFLIAGEQPLLYHTGLRRIFFDVKAAIERVLPVSSLRYVAFSHYEADECGTLNAFLALAKGAVPVCSEVAKMTSVDDTSDRPARALKDGEELDLGRHRVRWLTTPHLPHAWECGHLFETRTRTLFCGDLFTQLGDRHEPVTEKDILGPSEEARGVFDYYAATRDQHALIEKLALTGPTTLACMHGASWRGDGAKMLRALARTLEASQRAVSGAR